MTALLLAVTLLQPLPPPEPVPVGLHDLILSWYDPAQGGINCSADCSTFGSGQRVVAKHYGRVAACLTEWRGRTVAIPGFGSWDCVDSGGAVVAHWTQADGLHVHVDVLRSEPIERGPWAPQKWELR